MITAGILQVLSTIGFAFRGRNLGKPRTLLPLLLKREPDSYGDWLLPVVTLKFLADNCFRAR